MTAAEHAAGASVPARGNWLAAFFLAALAATLVLIVLGGALGVHYKTAVRALPLLWAALLLLPAGRDRLPYRPDRADLPLALFAAAAVLSVALGEGHFGDVRNLLAAIGLGLLARALFAPPQRRPLFLHYLGGTVLLVLARELAANPALLPPRELARYALVTANPNVLGFLFAMAAPLLLAEAMAARGGRRAAAALYYAAAALGTLVTYSRTAAAGLAIGSLIVGLGDRRRGRALTLVAAGALAFLAVQRPHAWTASRAPGDADRARIIRTSLSLAAEAPLLGLGFGGNNLEARFPDRYRALYGERLFRFHSANQLVDLVVGTGAVGTALACWWATGLALGARRRLRAARAPAERLRAGGGAAALAAIGLMSLAEPPLYHGKLLPILFLVLAWTQLEPDPGAAGTGRP